MILAAVLHHRNSKSVACQDGSVVVRTIVGAAAAQLYRALARNGSFRHEPTGRRSLDDLRNGEIVVADRIDDVVLHRHRAHLLDHIELVLNPLVDPLRDDALIVATVQIVLPIDEQAFDLVVALQQFLALIAGERVGETFYRSVAAASVNPAGRIGNHRVDVRLVRYYLFDQLQFPTPHLRTCRRGN